MSSRKPKPVLRTILRLLETPPLAKELTKTTPTTTTAGRWNMTRTFVLEQYRTPQGETTKQLQTLAQNYSQLLQDLRERKRLHELDTGADMVLTPRELSRRAAARAGLQLPELFDENKEPKL
jgi:hypothetical protein